MNHEERVLAILHRLHNEINEAKRRLYKCAEDHFEVGTYQEITYGRGVLRGEVEEVSDHRICLRLDSTGKRFWVDAYHAYRHVPPQTRKKVKP